MQHAMRWQGKLHICGAYVTTILLSKYHELTS